MYFITIKKETKKQFNSSVICENIKRVKKKKDQNKKEKKKHVFVKKLFENENLYLQSKSKVRDT